MRQIGQRATRSPLARRCTGWRCLARLKLVDQAFDGGAVAVRIGIVAYGPAALGTFLLSVGGLARLLRADGLDVAVVQVSAIAAGRVGLVYGGEAGGREWS
jgi:hypothetical protein